MSVKIHCDAASVTFTAKSSVLIEISRRSVRAMTYRTSESSTRTRLTRLELYHGCINAKMMSIINLPFCICSRFSTVTVHTHGGSSTTSSPHRELVNIA
jgi:hypothetical protein